MKKLISREFKKSFFAMIEPLFAVVIGVLFSLIAVKILGDSPLLVLKVLFKSVFGSKEDLATTLFYTTPLIFTGLSVMISLHAGLFNIGAEGQLLMGTMALTAFGLLFPNCPAVLAIPFAIVAAIIGGALYGLIPGFLRAYRGSHEVIMTIMLNFIASGVTSYLVLSRFKTTENQNAETASLQTIYRFPELLPRTPLNDSFFIALFCVILCSFFLWKTKLGYQLRMVGENPVAAEKYGISSKKILVLAMTLSGALAGLVGVNEICGVSGKFRMGFSPDYGFMGIAVALLGRKKPFGILGAALLFGALHKGTADLDLETEKVTRDFSLVLQAFIILSVSVSPFIRKKLMESRWMISLMNPSQNGVVK